MTNKKYTDTEEYQKEIAEQYKRRVIQFNKEEIIENLNVLGFHNIQADSIKTTAAGNMSATYLTDDFVIKMSKQHDIPNYLANKIVSDRLGHMYLPIIKVLAYDFFEKTSFEILVMKREPGNSLLNDIFEFEADELKDLFRQVLLVIKQIFTVQFNSFGWLNLEGRKSFSSFSEFLTYEFDINTQLIKKGELCKPEDIRKINDYFLQHINIFDTSEKPTIMHRDLHMGNFLHQGKKLTAIIDFDGSMKGHRIGNLVSLLSFIDNPSQYTEGSKYFAKYKGKNFHFLLSVLKEEFNEILSNKDLLRKLNLLFISDGIKWIAENWSQKWNEDMMQNLLANETPDNGIKLNDTYFAKILKP